MVKKQKQRRVELSVTPRLDVIGLSGQEVVEFRKKEVEMNDRDMLITKTRDSKNELESYILDNRPRIADGGILTEYMTKEQQAKFIQLANEYENWLYEDGADAELSVYQEKVKTLRAIGDAATDRRRNFEDVEFELPVFKQEVTKAKDTALGAIGKAEHITEEELREVAAKCDGALSWAEQEISRYREQPKSEAPLLTCATLREKQKEAVEAVRVVVQRPAPPKPKEAAAESKNEKSADEQAPAEVPPEENEEVPPVKDELD
uniref:Putative heat shock protein n=1 Tax=Trypanosoma congolense (strain IL3000) TaxID=1068625 RepID=G0UY36_TRYCI|nr:putative heat shock protein [Trypanosoma congolense IL3000]